MEKLYEYSEDFGRIGTLSGRMLLTDEAHDQLLGKSAWASEYLGKHSEVEVNFTADTVRLITDNQEFLETAKKLGVRLDSGFCIAEIIWEQEEDDAESEEEEDE
jgi:hypothetical protein